ncbi:MAG: lipopolysaccharide assembly protein LapA domain-containing protein [Syntrophotaleaceae bacterium]
MAKGRLIFAALLALLATTVILQNTQPVETRILFLNIILPHALLLLVTLLTGFALGVIVTMLYSRSRGKGKASKKSSGSP